VFAGAVADPVREGLGSRRPGTGLACLGRDLLADVGLER